MKYKDKDNTINIDKKPGVPVTEIEHDKDNKEFFFVATVNGEDCHYSNKSVKKLKAERDELIQKLKEEVKNEFKGTSSIKKLQVLKKSKEKKAGRVFKTDTKVGNIEYMQMRRKIILEGKLRGLEKSEIVSVIQEEFELSYPRIMSEILEVDKEIMNHSIITHEEILTSHLYRYEELYKKFREENVDGYAMRALKCKEAIAGLHDQTVNIQINNFLDKEFDVKLLDKDEQKRLKTLLSKVIVR